MPPPWVTEVAEYARAHRNADLGLSLTLTSGWDGDRWGRVASKHRVPGLQDARGTPSNVVAPVASSSKPDEVGGESGAHAYKLPFLTVRGEMLGLPDVAFEPNGIVRDAVPVAGPHVTRDRWEQVSRNAVAALKPGITGIIVYLGHDDAELLALTEHQEPYGAASRQQDCNVKTSPESSRRSRTTMSCS